MNKNSKKLKLLIVGSNSLIGNSFLKWSKFKGTIITCSKKDNLQIKLNKKPDVILNLAGEQRNHDKMWSSNLIIVKKILDHVTKHKCYLIQTGSSSEYGIHSKPTKENNLLLPSNIYSGTKAAATMIVSAFAKGENLNAIVVRPYCIYGHFSKKNRLIPLIIHNIFKEKKMTIYDGNQDYLYVKDYVGAMDRLILKRKLWSRGEIINVGSGKQYSNIQVVKIIEKVFEKKLNYKEIKRFNKPTDAKTWRSGSNILKNKYKFSHKYSLYQGILDMKKNLKIHS